MRRLWQRKTALLFALLLLAMDAMPSMTARAYTGDGAKTGGMELVAQSEEAQLYLDRAGAVLRLVDRGSGIAVDTKIVDGSSGNASVKANQKSDFLISYFLSSKASAPQEQNNYAMAIEAGQMEYAQVENGVRVSYLMKEDKLSIECVPKYISMDRMESLVLSYLDKDQKEALLKDYYQVLNDRYVRMKNGGGVPQSAIRTVKEWFYEVGSYTEEDLLFDNTENEWTSPWTNLEIRASVEYILDGRDLVVRLPMEGVAFNNEKVILNTVTLLPYLLSATQEETGYFVVPDGSGAAINFNNGLTHAIDYSSRVYGKDVLMDIKSIPSAEYFANMPIIGAVYEDYAVLAIVEEGQALAEINVQVAGKLDDYNKAYFRFYLTEKENVATSSAATVNVNKFTGDTFSGTIQVRYKLLTDPGERDYTGLAHMYRQYLIDQGVLERREGQEASVALEVLGSTLEARTLLGFPYKGVRALTTFKEAAAILEDLSSRGVANADVQLDGWLDGGQRHEKLAGIGLEGAQGSKSSFKALTETAGRLGYGFYPDVALQNLYPSFDLFQGGSAKSYAKRYGSRYLSNDYAVLTETVLAGYTTKEVCIWSPYLLSPAYLEEYTQKAAKSLSKYGISGMTVTDLGTQLVADYNEKAPVSRETAMGKVAGAMGTLEQSYELMMKAPYQYAWKGVAKMSDIPTRSTEYTIFNYDIPFLQLVLDGCVSYTTEPLNYHTEKSIQELLLKCIETRSNPKFYVMDAGMDELQYANYADYLSITYSDWAERIGQAYREYKDFADKVQGSSIASHQRLSDSLVKVAYENGVEVYVNYGDKAVSAEGNELAAYSYLLKE